MATFGHFGALGVPLNIRARTFNRLYGIPIRPRARQPYQRVTPSFGPGRSQMQMDRQLAQRGLHFGITDAGADLGSLDRFGAPLNKGPGENAAFEVPQVPAVVTAPKGADPALDELAKYAPLASSLLHQLMEDDPRTDYRVYQAKVKNLRETIRSVPPFLQPFFRARLREVEARLRAAKERRKLEVESEQATRTWRWFGWTGAGTAIVAGLALGTLLLAGATANRRTNPGRHSWAT